jgi:threonine synthase
MTVAEPVWHRVRGLMHGFRLDDPGTEAEIRRLHATCGYLADPHSAIGIAAARALPCAGGVPVVAMATAHPAKFPDAMERATGHRPPLPPRMADLFEREERFAILPNDPATVEAAVRTLVGRNTAQGATAARR